jgi:hypothetical protein
MRIVITLFVFTTTLGTMGISFKYLKEAYCYSKLQRDIFTSFSKSYFDNRSRYTIFCKGVRATSVTRDKIKLSNQIELLK